MRMSTARFALAAAGLAVVGLVGAADAASTSPSVSSAPRTLTIADAAGDAVGGQASMDIKEVRLTTTGTSTTKTLKGKKVTTYTPKALVVKLTLAAAPSTLPVANFEVDAETSACGSLTLYYDGQDLASGGYVSCGSPKDPATGSTATYLTDGPVVEGSTVTWTMPFASLPKEVAVGSSISAVHAYVGISEPLTGFSPSLVNDAFNADNAGSDATYKIG